VVGSSNWITECSKKSSLLKDKNHATIPNPVDSDIFKPIDKNLAREIWNLPKSKKIILFGSVNPLSDERKVFKQLVQSLQKLSSKNNIELVIFGSVKPREVPDFPFQAHYVGYVNDDVSLATLYSSADLALVPSLQENLPNVAIESLSCGTPVVAFNVGGIKDIIEHKVNGYLAKPYDVDDFANGIKWILDNPNYNELCQNARKKILKEFDSKIVARKYIKLFNEILSIKKEKEREHNKK